MPRRKGGFDESIKNNGEVLVLVVVAVVVCVMISFGSRIYSKK